MYKSCEFNEICESCNKSGECGMGGMAFSCSTNSILKEINKLELGTTSESYSHFLLSSKKMEMKLNNTIYLQIEDLISSDVPFDVEMYFRLDKIFLIWMSWYRRILLYLRLLLLNESYCINSNKIIINSLKEYFDNNITNYYIPYKEEIFKFFNNKILNIGNPQSNGDYADVAELYGKYLLLYFKFVIIQYAQNYLIDNQIPRLYYSNIFPLMEELEDINLNTRIEEISKFSKKVEIVILNPLNLVEKEHFEDKIINIIKPKIKNITIN